MEKEVEGSFDVGILLVSEQATSQDLKSIEEEVQLASDVVEIFDTCNDLNYISDNI